MQDLINNLVKKVPVVADEDHGAIELDQRFLQRLTRGDVQVIGGLVHRQQVKRPQHQLGHLQPVALSAGQALHLAKTIVAREAKAPQIAARGVLVPVAAHLANLVDKRAVFA